MAAETLGVYRWARLDPRLVPGAAVRGFDGREAAKLSNPAVDGKAGIAGKNAVAEENRILTWKFGMETSRALRGKE
jgi:hypothetical protein